MSHSLSSAPKPSSISPVIVGHRGFKSQYTENTVIGFTKCYESGATVLETDLWLSSDNVIVISHDQSTKRIFVDSEGNDTDYVITETPFDPVLKSLKTKEGGYPLLAFVDLVTWYQQYVASHEEPSDDLFKLQLDIKKFNPTKITKNILTDLLSVHDDLSYWYSRVQFGIWDLKFLKYLNQDDFFQSEIFGAVDAWGNRQFDVFHISLNWRDSINYINYNYYLDETTPKDRKSLKLTGVSLLYISTWSTEFLTKFIPLLQIQGLKFYSWTINNKFQFQYLNKVGEMAKLVEYGIITDSPDTMVEYKDSLLRQRLESIELHASDSASSEKTLVDYGSNQYYNEDGDLNIELTLRQQVLYWLYTQFTLLNGSNRKIKTESQKFAYPVDGDKVEPNRTNPLASWLFQTCQKYGIF
ncbi:uncharacterized protein LODBEIA_P41360 [Lodderomyces beijingensis]|uniref:GP-PDE domain-containing protein n=1 Tax=Lodderomyces beijingensis TaxID=1775926 RepID=A0ABP0ZP51_9ASCO